MVAARKHSTVIGVFEDRLKADEAVSELLKAGFHKDQIGVAMRHAEGTGKAVVEGDSNDSEAGTGAITGALAGLGLGALAGLGVLAGVIPVIGPAIAAGTLGVLLSNAAAGAGIAGLAGALVGLGIPEHDAKYYHEEFEAGRTIVTVTADRADEAMVILRRHGAYDMSSRGSVEDQAASSATATPTRTAARSHVAASEGDTIELKEERLHAQKRPVEAGEVTVRKEVHTETKTLDVPVQREEVVIERKPVHGKATTGITANDLREGEEIRIPVREEEVTVSKDAVVTEEVKVGKRVINETERVSGQVSKEEVKVKTTGKVDLKTRDDGSV